MQSLTVLFTSSQQYDQTFVAGESKIIFASGDLYLYKKKNGFGSGSKMLIFKKKHKQKTSNKKQF